MIRQSFQNIVNPENIIENFGSGDADADTTKYYELISNMESQCDVIIDEMDISNFSVSDDNKCVTDGRTYAKSDKDYVTLRRENLNRIEVEYNKINGETTLTDFEKNSQLLCIMNKLFYNIKQVTENNDEMSKKNLEKENLGRENDHLIEKNREIKKKDKDLNLVTNANVIGSKESQRQIQTQYIIFMVLIAIFLIIQVVLFFV